MILSIVWVYVCNQDASRQELDSSEMTHCRWVYACLDLDIRIVLWCWWVTDPDFNLAGNAVGGESNLSLSLQGRTFLYIYHLELISALALLSVSQGLSACSPSVLKQLLHSPNSRTMAQQQQIRYGPVHQVRWDNRNEACSNCFFVNPIVLYNKHRICHLSFALVPMCSTLLQLYVSCLLYFVNKLFSIASTKRYTSMGHTPRSIMSFFHITSA